MPAEWEAQQLAAEDRDDPWDVDGLELEALVQNAVNRARQGLQQAGNQLPGRLLAGRENDGRWPAR